MDPSVFDAFTRRLAGSRRAALTALTLGVSSAFAGVTESEARKKKGKKKRGKKKKNQCTSRCGGKCCKKGTTGTNNFPEDGDGCTCCKKNRIWTSYSGARRCCRPGTKAMPDGGFSTNGGPCCPAAQYCNGSCCNSGYICRNNTCVEECVERAISAQLATGGVTRGGEVTAEDTACDWPETPQEACITGYVCTTRKVCCRPEETPCGGSPGQRGACCTADEVCNPKFDADPDGHNFAVDGRACLKRC